MKQSKNLLECIYCGKNGIKKTVLQHADSHGRCRFDIDLVDDEKNGIDFYPCDQGHCIIANLKILSNYDELPDIISNGINLGNSYIFLDEKPVFSIGLNGKESWLEIYFNYLNYGEENVESVFEKIIALVRQQESQLQREDDYLRKENEYLNKIEELTDRFSNSSALCSDLKNTITWQKQEIQKLQADYNAIANSTFWKLTRPLRHFADIFKSIVKKNKNIEKAGVSFSKKVSSFQELAGIYPRKDISNYRILIEYDNSSTLKILLVTHELALTGAPVALFYFAEILKEQGFCPVLIAPRTGNLIQECEKKEIPVIVDADIYQQVTYLNYIGLFDLVIANTIVSAPVVNGLKDVDIPVLWWIHEAEVSYNEEHFFKPMPQHLPDNVVVYTVGAYAHKMLLKYKPLYVAKNLLYYIPEVALSIQNKTILPPAAKEKAVFCIVGLLEYRKGQDVLVDAIWKLKPDQLENSYFVFVGRQCYSPLYEKIMGITRKYPNNSIYIEELNRTDISQLYEEIDCLVCASKDDPMPIVVTEALQHGKFVICSENTGTASILKQEQYGIIYGNNDPEQLAEALTFVIENKDALLNQKNTAIQIYKKYFSKEVFLKNALNAVRETRDFYRWKPQYQGTLFSIDSFVKELELQKAEAPYCMWGQSILGTYDGNGKRNVLLVSHEMSLTGAPIVLHTLGKILKSLGFNVTIISPFNGPLAKTIAESEIPVIIYDNLYANDFLRTYAECFDLILLNTVVTYRLIEQLRGTQVPILWWIHDSKASYETGGFEKCLPKILPSNVHIYCAGEYAREKLLEYYPEYQEKSDVLYYCVPDVAAEYDDLAYRLPFEKSGRILFTIIGLQDSRKGHDIFAAAIDKLSPEVKEKTIFLFIGKHLDQNIEDAVNNICASYPDHVFYIEEVEHHDIFSVISQSDCVVCSSKDDPLPVFITEAMMMGRLTICSEYTGSAPIIEKEHCGFVYENNDFFELAKKIEYVTAHFSSLQSMCDAARKAYEAYFSEVSYQKVIQRIMDDILLPEDRDIMFQGTVSVVIPSYNGGPKFEETLSSLRAQKKVKKIEIIVVDSGSHDQTLDICHQYNVRLYEISHEDFSHSYARNLGARYAVGDILLFMTQDAVPIGEDWVYQMIVPIINREAVATSCREKNPENTELFYKIATKDYAIFRHMIYGDQLNSYDGNESLEELRRKASLTDIATAILASVFKQLYYRFGYAEDLDMGIRLLQNGYRIMLLKDACVLHGHNRSCGYYIRRAFVESRSFERVLPSCPINRVSFPIVALRIMSACRVVFSVNSFMLKKMNVHCMMDEYISNYIYELNAEISEDTAITRMEDCYFGDEILDYCFRVCRNVCAGEVQGDYTIVYSVICYLNTSVLSYFANNKARLVDRELAQQIEDCVLKQMSIFIGDQLSHVNDRSLKLQNLKDLMQGV